MVYSFDIFDTLITRKLRNPHDVFSYMETVDSLDIINFKKKRVQAELNARRRNKYEEITLDEIYEELKLENTISDNYINELKNKEIEAELVLSIPIKKNIDYLNSLVNDGEKVILISDMYLSKQDICELLLKHNIPTEKIEIFISSEYRLTKHSGKLFKHILKELQIHSGEMQHIGDNKVSDVLIPKLLGIRTKLYWQSKINHYEELVFEKNPVLANYMRISRLMNEEFSNNSEMWSTATNVVAPITVGYMKWIKQFAIMNNINKLLFVSRDGQLMYKVWDILYSDIKEIEYSYIYGSRKVWYFPSITNEDRYWYAISTKGWIKTENILFDDFLEQFNIYPEDIPVLLKCLPELFNYSVKEIVTNRLFIEYILNKSRENRKIVSDYFAQLGIRNGDRIALVDLGWTGQSLESAREIICDKFPKCSVYGLVLGKRNAGNDKDWLNEWMISDQFKCHRSEVYLLETIYAATHETVIRYKYNNGVVIPVFKEKGRVQNDILDMIKCQQSAACKLAYLVRSELEYIDIDSNVFYSVFQEFVFNPTIENIKAYVNYPFSRDSGDKEYILLVRKLNLVELITQLQVFNLICIKVFHKEFKQKVYWLEASAKISGKTSQILTKIDNVIVRLLYKITKKRW